MCAAGSASHVTLGLANAPIFANMAPCGFNTQNLHMYKHRGRAAKRGVCFAQSACTCYLLIHVTAPGRARRTDARGAGRGGGFSGFPLGKCAIRERSGVANIRRSHTLFGSQHGNCYWAQADTPPSAETRNNPNAFGCESDSDRRRQRRHRSRLFPGKKCIFGDYATCDRCDSRRATAKVHL